MEHLSLYKLNQLVKQTLDANLAPSYWVVAEIGEMRSNQSGHCYLELIEKVDDKVIAKTRGTIWSYTYRNLSTWFEGMTGESLRPGIQILCNLTIQYHELYGLSVNIKDIDANFTLGERARRRKEIIDKLIAEGVYDMNKMHPLPVVPQKIAVISSPSAAGYGDFMDQIEQNSFGYNISTKLFKAVMQGDKAAESIITAMMQVYDQIDDFDVLVIIRGGGSQIDLDCFDEYELANHIAQFPLPIITGIGHERDETIADLVAHTQMKTPTAVAEFLIAGIRAFETKMDEYFARIYNTAVQTINLETQKLNTFGYQIKSGIKGKLSDSKYKLESMSHQLKTNAKHFFQSQQRQLELADKALQLLNPETILKRGYSITTVNGKLLSKTTAKPGDKIVTETSKQIITSTIDSFNKKDGKEKS